MYLAFSSGSGGSSDNSFYPYNTVRSASTASCTYETERTTESGTTEINDPAAPLPCAVYYIQQPIYV